MMRKHMPPAGPMETTVRLRRGIRARTATITVALRSDRFDALEVACALGTFASAVDAGLFGDDSAPLITHALLERHEKPLSVAAWEASFPRMPPEAFAVAARMIAASVRGAQRFEVREDAPEPTLLVKRFEDDPDATMLDLPWRLVVETAEVPELRIVFRDPLGAEAARWIREVLDAWTACVRLGGFRAPDRASPSIAEPWRIDRFGDREMTTRFVCLSAEHQAFEALFQALLRVHEAAPIALVRIATAALAPCPRRPHRGVSGASSSPSSASAPSSAP